MNKKIKVLYIFGGMPEGGVATVIKNIIININKDEFEISLLLNEGKDTIIFLDFLKENSIEYTILPSLKLKNIIQYIIKLFDFYKRNRFDCIHLHSPSLVTFNFFIAKIYGIKTRIIHTHSIKSSDTLVKRIRNKLLMLPMHVLTTHYCACGKDSAISTFGNNLDVFYLKNGINTELYKYNEKIRNKIRLNLHLESKFVLGHVGRLSPEKNQLFLLEVMKNLDDNYHLVLVGDGTMRTLIVDKIKQMNLENKVSVVGNVDNVNEYMQLFDFFLLPSLFEGMPLVLVEAQASGLPVIASTNVPRESKLTENMVFLSTNSALNWKDYILNYNFTNDIREDKYKKITEKGFDIHETVSGLERWYKRICKS